MEKPRILGYCIQREVRSTWHHSNHRFIDTIIEDLRSGKTFELEKNERDGIKESHFDNAMKKYLEDIVPHVKS